MLASRIRVHVHPTVSLKEKSFHAFSPAVRDAGGRRRPVRPAERKRVISSATSMIHWHCHDVYRRMPDGATAGGIAVVIDVLRASTTIVTALAHGAARVVPVAEVDEARRRAVAIEGSVVLGGERGGLRIPGFDLGNSPRE